MLGPGVVEKRLAVLQTSAMLVLYTILTFAMNSTDCRRPC